MSLSTLGFGSCISCGDRFFEFLLEIWVAGFDLVNCVFDNFFELRTGNLDNFVEVFWAVLQVLEVFS